MEQQFYDRVPPRRESEPRHHYQPKYPDPTYRPRRHTDGLALQKMHSRPEDYRNKPRPEDMVSYICFDGEDRPMEIDEMDLDSTSQPEPEFKTAQAPLDRVDSAASRNSSNNTHESEYDGDADSEDELTLPACYQHDIASREYDSWPKHQSSSPRRDSNSPNSHFSSYSPTRHDLDPAAQHDMSRDHHHKQQYTDAYRRYHDDERQTSPRHDRPGSRREGRGHRRQRQPEPQNRRDSSPSLSPTTTRSHDHDDRHRYPPPSPSHAYARSHSHGHRQRASDDDDNDDDENYDSYHERKLSRSSRPSRSPSPSRRHSSTGSAHGDNLIAQVAHHLAQHKDEYKSLSDHRQGDKSTVVSELLGQVMRKIEDGGLDGNMMREVVREVQHVL